MSQLYVPDSVFLVCTEGMKKQKLAVSSQTTIKIADGRLIATENDRMGGNHNCALMVIAGAIIGAIIAAAICAAVVLSGGTLAIGLGTALAIGAAGGAGLGAAIGAFVPCICAMLTLNWLPLHPKVFCESQKALLENSVIPCKLGGMIVITYSEEKANAMTNFKIVETIFSTAAIIFVCYSGGAALQGAANAIGSIVTVGKLFGLKSAVFQAGGILFGILAPNPISWGYDHIKENVEIDGHSINDHIEGKADGLEDNRVNRIMDNDVSAVLDDYVGDSGDAAEGVLDNQFDSYHYVNQQTIEARNTGNVITVTPDGTALPQNTTIVNTREISVSDAGRNASIAPASTTVTESTTITSNEITATRTTETIGVQYRNSAWEEFKNTYFSKEAFKNSLFSLAKDIIKDGARLAANKTLALFMGDQAEAEDAEMAAKAKITVIEHDVP